MLESRKRESLSGKFGYSLKMNLALTIFVALLVFGQSASSVVKGLNFKPIDESLEYGGNKVKSPTSTKLLVKENRIEESPKVESCLFLSYF